MHVLREELLALDAGKKALRSFGVVVGAVLLGIAVVVAWRNGWTVTPAAGWLAGLGGALVVLGGLAPRLLRPVYYLWMALALVMGFVMTRVLLTLVFFLLITPIGLVMRLAGKDPMHRRPDPDADSYWIEKDYIDDSAERLEKYY